MEGDFQQITHPDDLPADLTNVARLVAGEATSHTMENRYVPVRNAVSHARATRVTWISRSNRPR